MSAQATARQRSDAERGTADDRPRLLVVQHQDNCPPALFAAWLWDSGLALDVRRPDRGDPLPEDLGAHAGLLVLGGGMGANDDGTHPWLAATKTLLARAVEAGVPTLGICLGHQLAAVALGGACEVNPAGQTTGARAIGWLAGAADDPLCRPLVADPESLVPHWNSDVVTTLPPGARVLAETADGAPQVIRLGERAWGVQFHPEVDHQVLVAWAEEERAEGKDGAGFDAALRQVRECEVQVHRTGRKVAEAFAAVVLGDR